MTLTHKIYDDLQQSLKDGDHKTLSKLYTTQKGVSLIFAMERDTDMRSLFFTIDDISLEDIPRCKGLSLEKVHLYEYSPVDFFLQISQNKDGEEYIYEVIVEDIRKDIEEVPYGNNLIPRVSKLLLKWKTFFSQDKTLLLSPEKQQGLFGELLFLKQLILLKGCHALSHWTGYEQETHDFYVEGNAYEIKTTSTKAPYKMHISSEYQLDDKEVDKDLYVNFYALRKSVSDGKTLPELIEELQSYFVDYPLLQKKFEEGLNKYGYFFGLEDKYGTGYHIREEQTFMVKDGFPRITKESLNVGVSKCTYDVSVETAVPYRVSEEEKVLILKGSETNG